MCALTSTNTEATLLAPTALLDLFELDMNPIGVNTQLYLVSATSSNYQAIVFGGQTYIPFPVLMSEQGYDGQGSIVRPKLKVSNINGFVSSLLLQNQDLVGATITWTRVFARFIDAVNFTNGISPYTPDANAAYAPEIYYIFRKTGENQQEVNFELATSFEMDGRKLPSMTVLANFCQWRYREQGTCGYNGPPIADINNNLFSGSPYNFNSLNNRGLWSSSNTYNTQDYITIYSSNQSLLNIPLVFVCLVNGTTINPLSGNTSVWVQDACPHTLAACRIRFPFPIPIPAGMFPGLTRSPFVQGYSNVQT